MKRVWLLSIVLLAVAALEFGALGAASAGASFLPGWLTASKDGQQARRGDRTPVSTPVSPPSCRPDREHGGGHACEGEPASIQLTPDPLVIQCDGYDRSTLTVRITDANGRPVADGTLVSFSAYNGNAMPSGTQTQHGVASTSVAFYGDIFPMGTNVNVYVGPLEAGVRIRCFPESNKPPSPPCAVGSPPASPPCATPTPPPCSPSPRSVSPPCATPSLPPCSVSPPSLSPPCATPTPTPCPGGGGCSGRGVATLAVTAPHYAQPIGVPFQALVDLMYFKPGPSTGWAGYDLELAYDATILQANSDAGGLCSADKWSNTSLAPHIVSGCYGQESTATGTLENISFTCLKAGTSSLRLIEPGALDALAVGTRLFDVNAQDFATVLINASVQCGSESGSATIAVSASRSPQAIGVPFGVAVDLTAFTPGTATTWAGYSIELAYDTTVLQVNSVVPGLCPASAWGNPELTPSVRSACVFQASTATGTLETITFTCLKNGVSPLRLISPDMPIEGTTLFDVNGQPFATTLVSGSVTCGGPDPTATPSPTASAIPVG